MDDLKRKDLRERLQMDERLRRLLRYKIALNRGEELQEGDKEDNPKLAEELVKLGVLRGDNYQIRDDVDVDGLEIMLREAIEQVEDQDMPVLRKEWLENWNELIEKGEILDYMASQINPKVIGLDRLKKAILLSLVSAGDKYGDRGRIHVLMTGPPGTAKSAMGLWLAHQLGIHSCSHRTSQVGLTGDASGKEIVPGALPCADDGAIYIDELDKFKPADHYGLLESMADGQVTIHVGKIHAQLNAKCRTIASSNKTEKLTPELLDRFDFIIELSEYSRDEEKQIASHIASQWFSSKPSYYGSELKAFIDWIKSYEPSISEDVRKQMQEVIQFFIDLNEDVRGSMRRKESIIRVAYAIAKIHRREMRIEDVVKAIQMLYPNLSEGQVEALRRFIG